MQNRADIGVIGLAVMGQNLVLNMNDKGFTVAVHNRTNEKTDEFLSGPAKGKPGIIGAGTLKEFVGLLKKPRKIMLMVKAGTPVDALIDQLLPILEKGDVIVDGGNSLYEDTRRRTAALEAAGYGYIGLGVSGGEEGARNGPSLMPGGSEAAWPLVKDIFMAIAARTPSGVPCCSWIGKDGAGHFVKMVHNSIEYADMEVIAETYQFMHDLLHLSYDEMRTVYASYNKTEASSYLLQITSDIMGVRDDDGSALLDKILDAAGQKGTGKWAGISSLDLGVPAALLTESVFARSLSAIKDDRINASVVLNGPQKPYSYSKNDFIEDIRKTLVCSRIVAYSQGFMLMRAASKEYGWDLDLGAIALDWRAGCIIRSVFLDDIKAAFDRDPGLPCLMLDGKFKALIDQYQLAWRYAVTKATEHGIPIPAISSALSFYDGYRSPWLPANLIQAQRDYFGAHTYERVDRPRGETFHTNWMGNGDSQPSSGQ
jgi:6-phosphogluconate dehydrogenase